MFITLAGTQGSGKSTLCKIFVEKYGFELIKVSGIMRQLALERGVSILQMNEIAEKDPNIDKMIDEETTRIANKLAFENKNAIFDSRMAWHFVPHSIKVFLTADERTRAERILQDDTRGAVETFEHIDHTIVSIRNRLKLENERYKKVYNVDNLDMSNYDIVLDSTHKSPDELADEVVAYAKAHHMWIEQNNDDLLYKRVKVTLPADYYPSIQDNCISGVVTSVDENGITIDDKEYLAFSHINSIEELQ